MKRRKRQASRWIAGTVALLAVLSVWTVIRLRSDQQAVMAQLENLARCRALAEEIGALRGEPKHTSLVALSGFHPATFLDDVAARGQLPKECIVYVRSTGARRVGESVYLEHSVQVPLKGVSMAQFVQFLHACTVANPELRAKEVRLSPPARADDSSASSLLWDVDLTLTYFTVSRKTPPPKS